LAAVGRGEGSSGLRFDVAEPEMERSDSRGEEICLSNQVVAAIIAGGLSALVSVTVAAVNSRAQRANLRAQEERQQEELRAQAERLRTEFRTEFMAEQAIHSLLSEGFPKRSFAAIKKRLRGFDDNELRKLLIRAGAVCFEGQAGKELWGLQDRTKNDLEDDK